jgi:hypothetical protein
MNPWGKSGLGALLLTSLIALPSWAIDVASTLTALRLRNSITGGLLPVSDPIFTDMVAKVQAGDTYGAALSAARSKYFANYLARRLALQMQTPALETAGIRDSDATAFLIAHFTGAAPRLSTIWSENATYLVVGPQGKPVHASDLSTADADAVDWSQLVRSGGQQDGNGVFLPVKHVGGYTTLSDRPDDTSFAIYGATAGTNLRMIEGIWEIATGLTLLDVASGAASVQQVPRFVPEYDPNFFEGQGQQACISCHGSGMSSLDHGYATVANIFDVTGNGFVFISNPTTGTMKSLGSDPGARARNLACSLTRTPTPVCNPESSDVDPQQGWDVSRSWEQSGVLKAMGWMGPAQGQGLQSLGFALGQSWIVYQFFTQRVIHELCPLGTFSALDINRIAAAANPWAEPAGTDDIRTIVAQVAISPGCL